MDRIKLSIEHISIKGVKQTEFFLTPWFNGDLKIKVDKVGKIVDVTTGKVVGEFRLIGDKDEQLYYR